MKRIFVLAASMLVLAVCLPALGAHRHRSQRMVSAEVTVKQISGPSQGLFYGLKWTKEGHRCRAMQGNPGQPEEWVPIPSRACKSVRDYILSHRAKLRRALLSKKYVYNGIKPGRAYLEFSGSRFLVTLLTAPVCDDERQHCRRPKLTEASRVAFELRQAISRELGRLPEWVKPPGAETLGDP